MPIKPEITKGIGALNPDAWRQIVAAAQFVSEFGQQLKVIAANGASSGAGGIFLAKIDSASALQGSGDGEYLWKYSWTKVVLQGSQSTVTTATPGQGTLSGSLTDGSTASPSTWAINMHEIGNTSALRNGYTHASDSISGSEGYRIVRVPNTTVVPMTTLRLDTGRMQYAFWYPNPVGGSCAAGFTGFVNAIDGGAYGV
jgi:hypothetical protein